MFRRCAIVIACVAATSVPVLAAGPVDRILDDLARLGYGQVTVERTLLGRTRIVASSEDTEREIIMDPRTGEILRDLWVSNGQGTSGGGLVGGGRSGSNSGTGSSDDDEDDDDDDEDSDDDDDDGGGNSGPGGGDDGGGNSGSGGGDDGGDDDD